MSKREAYTRKAEARLSEKRAEIDKAKAKLDQAKAKAKGASADAELEARRALDEVESKYEAAKRRLGELLDAGEDAWEDVSQGFESAWDEVSGAAKRLFARKDA